AGVVAHMRGEHWYRSALEQVRNAAVVIEVQMSQQHGGELETLLVQCLQHWPSGAGIDDYCVPAVVHHPDVVVFASRAGLNANSVHDHALSSSQATIICAAKPPTNANVRSHGTRNV